MQESEKMLIFELKFEHRSTLYNYLKIIEHTDSELPWQTDKHATTIIFLTLKLFFRGGNNSSFVCITVTVDYRRYDIIVG